MDVVNGMVQRSGGISKTPPQFRANSGKSHRLRTAKPLSAGRLLAQTIFTSKTLFLLTFQCLQNTRS